MERNAESAPARLAERVHAGGNDLEPHPRISTTCLSGVRVPSLRLLTPPLLIPSLRGFVFELPDAAESTSTAPEHGIPLGRGGPVRGHGRFVRGAADQPGTRLAATSYGLDPLETVAVLAREDLVHVDATAPPVVAYPFWARPRGHRVGA